MKSNYVTIEVAKLLKEKGFNEPCKSRWHMYKTKEPQLVTNLYKTKGTDYILLRPTIHQAVDWIRDSHNISIEIHSLGYRHKYEDFMYRCTVYKRTKTVLDDEMHDAFYGLKDDYKAYFNTKEALLDGLKVGLNILETII